MATKKKIRRSSISLKKEAALTATRVSLGSDRLVYVLAANKPIKYTKGRSKIAYIGTTKNGMSRVASSAAGRAEEILGRHGIRSFSARIVTCRNRQKVKMWRKLESALLLQFRQMFGRVPICNTQGKNMLLRDELEYFQASRLRSVIETLSR